MSEQFPPETGSAATTLEHHRAEESAMTAAILEAVAEAVVGIDHEGRLTFANPAAARMLGYEASEMLGRSAHDVWHHRRPDGSSYPIEECATMRMIRAGISYRGRETYVRKDGSSFPVEFALAPIRVGDTVTGTVQTFRDISPLRDVLVATVEAMGRMAEMRDPYTAGHEQRVAYLAVAIGKEMRLPDQTIEGLYFCGALHDIGKIGIPAEILNRPGRLDLHQMGLIRNHAQMGFDILGPYEYPWPVAVVAHQHHERIDGSGYPNGLRGDQIALEARIVAVADTIEAMSSHRPYRPGLGIDAALGEVTKNRGRLYDEAAVGAALAVFANGHGMKGWFGR